VGRLQRQSAQEATPHETLPPNQAASGAAVVVVVVAAAVVAWKTVFWAVGTGGGGGEEDEEEGGVLQWCKADAVVMAAETLLVWAFGGGMGKGRRCCFEQGVATFFPSMRGEGDTRDGARTQTTTTTVLAGVREVIHPLPALFGRRIRGGEWKWCHDK
jgi:hypothetical protein